MKFQGILNKKLENKEEKTNLSLQLKLFYNFKSLRKFQN